MPPKSEVKTLFLYGHWRPERPDGRIVAYVKVTLPKRYPRQQALDLALERVPELFFISAVTNRQFSRRDGGVRGLWTRDVKVMHHHNAG